MRLARLTASVLLCSIIALLAPIRAEGGSLRLRIQDDSGNGVVLTDTNDDGFLTFSGVVGSFGIMFTAGLSKPMIGNDYLAGLHLTNLTVNASSGGGLTILLEDTDYTVGVGYPEVAVHGLVGGNLIAPDGSSVTTQSWANASNLVPDLGADQSVPGPLDPANVMIPAGSIAAFDSPATFGPGAFSAESYAAFVANGVYSLFSMTTIVLTGPAWLSFDVDTLVPVPELGTIALVATGLLGAARLTRRRLASSRVR